MYQILLKVLFLSISFGGFVESENIQYAISSIEDCPGIKGTFKIETKYENRALDASINLPVDIDDTFKYKVDVFKQGNDKKSVLSLEGKLCDVFVQLIPKVWEKLAEASGAAKQCPIKAGNYVLKQFKIMPEANQVPFSLNGNFSVESHIMNAAGEEMLCHIVKIESFAL